MKLLLADDDPSFRSLLGKTLTSWGYQVSCAADGPTAWQMLQEEGAPQLALLDWIMPGMDGPQVCRLVRNQTDWPYVYLLLLTGRVDKQDLISGLEAGADDYLIKPIDPDELRVRLWAGQRILNLQERLLTAQEMIRHQATHDPLTGLWNRAVALDALNRELARSRREGKPVGVLLADVDHFKHVNDTHGHLAGDAVLRQVSDTMRHALRPYDMVGRYGGEEFVVVLPECDAAICWKLGERLRHGISEMVVEGDHGPIPVTLSVGVASSSGWQQADAQTLLHAADAALYRAKRAGRNRVEQGTPTVEGLKGHRQDPAGPPLPSPNLRESERRKGAHQQSRGGPGADAASS